MDVDALKELTVDADLVRSLLRAQLPELADREVRSVSGGWDNWMVRLEGGLAVRLPRRPSAVELTRSELQWLPRLARRLPLPVPVPLHVGRPGPRFPAPWSVVPWIDGETPDRTALDADQPEAMAGFLRALHTPAPGEAPHNPFRGVPLAAIDARVAPRLPRVAMEALRPIWEEALATPAASDRRWLHGDLHPRNLIARDGRLAGVIDWGDLTAGDVATDLAVAWTVFPTAQGRRRFLDAYGASESQERRAAGWAVNFASAIAEWGEGGMAAIGRRALVRLLDDLGS